MICYMIFMDCGNDYILQGYKFHNITAASELNGGLDKIGNCLQDHANDGQRMVSNGLNKIVKFVK